MRRLSVIVAASVFVLAACSGSDVMGRVYSPPGSIGTGPQRVLVGLTDVSTGEIVIKPELTPVAVLRDEIGSPLGEYDGEFIWAIPDVTGFYAFDVDIPGPATYELTIDAGELGELAPVQFLAVEDPPQVTVGDQAPLSDTRTLDDAPLEDLTSDQTPVKSFYDMTVAEAVKSGPSVVIFATPAWCTSQFCGPMLDQVQALTDEYPGFNFVHVEVYKNIHVTEREDLVLAPAVTEWGLRSEPWLYVTDDTGTVTAAFAGAVSDDELRSALEAVVS